MSELSVRQVVITGVRSRTHLVHLAAYLRTVQEPVQLTYLTGGTFLGHARVDTTDVERFLTLPAGSRVEIVESIGALAELPDGPLTYLSVGAPGIKPWVTLRRARPLRAIHTVVTDEGLGTYGDWRTRRAAWRRQGVGEPWRTVRALAVQGAARGLTTTRFAMYDARHDFALDARIRAEFCAHVGDRRPDPDDERVIFLSSPWVEIGALREKDYLRHIEDILRETQSTGRRLVVRPHPAEDPSRYRDFDTVDGDLPAELDPAVVGASAAVGGTSTALLNLAALHHMPGTRVVTPGLEHLDTGLGRGQRALLSRYLPAPVRVSS
ncbi:polysialyltransferase family glycosyltransferase [Flexivirga sp. B27]